MGLGGPSLLKSAPSEARGWEQAGEGECGCGSEATKAVQLGRTAEAAS